MIKCLQCGREFTVVNYIHLRNVHNMTIDQYCEKFDINRKDVNFSVGNSQLASLRMQGQKNCCFRIKDKQKYHKNLSIAQKKSQQYKFGKTYIQLFGEKRALQIRHNMSQAAKLSSKKYKDTRGMKNKKHSEQSKEKMRQKTLKMIQQNKFKRTDTKPMVIIEKLLKQLNIKYQKEKIIHKFCVDFFLSDYNIIIQCDGDYWHANPMIYNRYNLNSTQLKNVQQDQKKNKYFLNIKTKLLRFWQTDIYHDIQTIKNKILESINECNKI